jgi:hypothetical protein
MFAAFLSVTTILSAGIVVVAIQRRAGTAGSGIAHRSCGAFIAIIAGASIRESCPPIADASGAATACGAWVAIVAGAAVGDIAEQTPTLIVTAIHGARVAVVAHDGRAVTNPQQADIRRGAGIIVVTQCAVGLFGENTFAAVRHTLAIPMAIVGRETFLGLDTRALAFGADSGQRAKIIVFTRALLWHINTAFLGITVVGRALIAVVA